MKSSAARRTRYRNLREDAELVCYNPLGGTPARRIGFQMRTGNAALGIVAAVLLVRLIEHRLYGISPVDPAMFAVTLAALVGVACVGCWMPARRAATLDPMIALRTE